MFVFKPLASVGFTLILETCPRFPYIRKPDKRLMFGWCEDEATCMHGRPPRFLELVCSTAFTLIWIVQKQIVLINTFNTASYLSLINWNWGWFQKVYCLSCRSKCPEFHCLLSCEAACVLLFHCTQLSVYGHWTAAKCFTLNTHSIW